MGVVYRARHVSSDVAVALKTVKVPSSLWLEAIRREIHALTHIRHPGIVRIVDHGVHQGLPWYAMDLLEGESLHRFAQRIWSPFRKHAYASLDLSVATTETVSTNSAQTELSPDFDGPAHAPIPGKPEQTPAAAGHLEEVLRVMRRVCVALAFLHGEGFINCDLKPSNIVLVDGRPVIIDFGLAAHYPGAYSREALETQRTMAGTLPYMAPEQIRGELADARTDLYAVGCLLYELVVGHPPFEGAPRTLITQHLAKPPVPPSELVTGVPEALERVILKLLEKDLSNRFGFADEVAAALGEIIGDARPLQDVPPARSYLYRPQFVGRGELLARAAQLRDRAAAGKGSLVLLGGESGVGKTRFALELTRLGLGSPMRVVTSQSSPLAAESTTAAGVAPLHTLRPLLQSIADRCQEGGAEVTERLLGARRNVLALYEPLLLHVPAEGSLPPPLPLPLDGSRQRLFSYLRETLLAFAVEKPVLLVLDDIGWADELSLAFLASLSPAYLESTPVFILCTYRSEEASDAVRALLDQPHVVSLTLPRLDDGAVQSMMRDMLAVHDLPKAFVEQITNGAEGNPFFVAEYLRAAVSERVLYRDQLNSWQIAAGPANRAGRRDDALPLPSSLRDLIGKRWEALSALARHAGLAGAVLGREPDLDLLREVAALSDEACVAAVDELLRRQIFEQPDPGHLRFAHDKLREVVYASANTESLRELHARAAASLEARWRDSADASPVWGTLGHHFAAAKLPAEAARYLRLAADHARSIHANGESIRLYREAISQVNELLGHATDDAARWRETLVDLHEALGDVLALIGQRDDARTAYEEALARVAERGTTPRARIHRKLGKTWETQHRHEEALRCYDLAKASLGGELSQAPQEEREEWIQIHIDRLWVYYWLAKVPELEALTRELTPIVERYASPLQRASFFETQVMRNLRRDRYVITEETLRFARTAVQACREARNDARLLTAQFGLGFVLVFNGQPELADAELRSALALAERGGDIAQQARCLSYIALAARMRGLVEETRRFAERCAEVAARAGMREYVAVALAHEAWLSLEAGDFEAASQRARGAVEIWREMKAVFPFQWLALLPLLQASLALGDVPEAVRCAESLLAPGMQSLAGDVMDALGRAVDSWRQDDQEGALVALRLAAEHVTRSEYQ